MRVSVKPHPCRALGCKTIVAETEVMCLKHWNKTPDNFKTAIWTNYTDGQERDRAEVTHKFEEAVTAAVHHVAAVELVHRIARREWRIQAITRTKSQGYRVGIVFLEGEREEVCYGIGATYYDALRRAFEYTVKRQRWLSARPQATPVPGALSREEAAFVLFREEFRQPGRTPAAATGLQRGKNHGTSEHRFYTPGGR